METGCRLRAVYEAVLSTPFCEIWIDSDFVTDGNGLFRRQCGAIKMSREVVTIEESMYLEILSHEVCWREFGNIHHVDVGQVLGWVNGFCYGSHG